MIKFSTFTFKMFEEKIEIHENKFNICDKIVPLLYPFDFIGINKTRLRKQDEAFGVDRFVILDHSQFFKWLDGCEKHGVLPEEQLTGFFNKVAFDRQSQKKNKEGILTI